MLAARSITDDFEHLATSDKVTMLTKVADTGSANVFLNLTSWIIMVHSSASRSFSDLVINASCGAHSVIELLQVGGQVSPAGDYQMMGLNSEIHCSYFRNRPLLAKSAGV
jgi:hypothetical protein